MNLNVQKFLLTILFSLLINYSAKAQQIIESFEDVNSLQPDGWVFMNNSDVTGNADWSQGVASNFPAQAGTSNSYITNTTATTAANLVCNWLIMPDIGAIEQLSFYTRSDNQANEVTRMKVMYSSTGDLTTGGCSNAPAKINSLSGSNDFGSFQTLLTINQNQTVGVYPQDWTQYTVDVNGSGRVAFLYYMDTGAPNFNSGTLAIDTITKSNSTIINTPQVVPTLGTFGVLLLLLTMLFFGYKNNRILQRN